MPAGIEYLFWALLFVTIGCIVVVYEITQYRRRHSRLGAPDRSIRRHIGTEWAGRP